MKKIISIIALLIILGNNLSAQTVTDGNLTFPITTTINGLEYTLYQDLTAQVNKQTDSLEEHVIIPTSVSYNNIEFEIVHISDEAFRGHNEVLSIDLRCGYISVGKNVFSDMMSLSKFIYNTKGPVDDYNYTETLYYYHNFENTPNLTDVEFGPEAVSIIPYFFMALQNVTKVIIPDNVEIVNQDCFASSEELKEVVLGEGIRQLHKASFNNCQKLEIVYFNCIDCEVPYDYLVPSYPPFGNRTPLLKTLYIGEKVEKIPAYTFYSVTTFTDIYSYPIQPPVCESGNNFTSAVKENSILHVPSGYIDSYKDSEVWSEFSDIRSMEGEPNEGLDFEVDGIWYTVISPTEMTVKTRDYGYQYGHQNLRGSLTIPSTVGFNGYTYTVVEIGEYSFSNCTGLTGELRLPDTLISIGDWAFNECSGLSGDLIIPNSVKKIGDSTFRRCVGFKGNLLIGSSVFDIAHDAFIECSGFTGDLIIPDAVISIGNGAFHNCNSFNGSLTIGNSVTMIGSEVFTYCGFTSLSLGFSVSEIGWNSFVSNRLQEIISSNQTPPSLSYGVFDYQTYNDAVLYVPAESINLYKNAEEWNNFSKIYGIGEGPSEGMDFEVDGIWYTVISPSEMTVKTRDNGNQYGHQNLTGSLTIPSKVDFNGYSFTVVEIGYGSFSECKGLTGELRLPETLKSIGDYAFYNCSGFTGFLTIPDSVTIIGTYAFRDCSGFNGTLTIGNSVTEIGHGAFQGDAGFVGSLIIPDSVITIDGYAFDYCIGFNGSLTIGNSVNTIGERAFQATKFRGDLIIGASVTTIDNLAFWATLFENVTSYNPVPPTCGEEVFYGYEMPLYVPDESVESYKEAATWGTFGNIYGISYKDGPKSISVNPSSLYIKIGESMQLQVYVDPASMASEVTWSSSDTSIATVTNDGTVTALSLGEVIITASCRNISATCVVTINPVMAESISLDTDYLIMPVGDTYQLTATVYPENITDKVITWKSDNEKVATVSEDGTVTAISVGEANITATCRSGYWAPSYALSQIASGYEGEATVGGYIISITDISTTYGNATYIIGDTPSSSDGLTVYRGYCLDGENFTSEDQLKVGDFVIVLGSLVNYNGTTPEFTSGSKIISLNGEGNSSSSIFENISATCKVKVDPILATSVSLNIQDLTLTEGQTYKLTATIFPENTTDKTVVWKSDNEDVATVSENGTIMALSVGKANITATCGEVSASCKVTVQPVLAEEIILNIEAMTIIIGQTNKITATVMPENTTDKTVTWKSDNEEVATVSEDGTIMALSVGKANITATCGEVSASCKVTVNPVEATSVSLSAEELNIIIGQTNKIIATVFPENTTDKTVNWSSDNSKVATVGDDGTVTAVSVGEAAITATCGNISASCKVNVLPVLSTGIVLNTETMSITIGETGKLTATVFPENVTNKTITWKSDNEKVVTVSSDGTVTAISIGIANIIATSGDVSATCKVTVKPVMATSVTLNVEALTIVIGHTDKIIATVQPENTTDKTVIWTSDNEMVATVDEYGTVKALSTGLANITATCGEVWATCRVTVDPVLSDGITLSAQNLTVVLGQKEKLIATVYPEETTDKTVTWKSDNMKVATVANNGIVTAVGIGTANIIATSGDVSATCKITVLAPKPVGISLSPLAMTLREGETGRYGVTFSPANAEATLTWSSADPSIAEVTNDGEVRAIRPGMTVITVTSDNGVTGMATVKVIDESVSSVTITPDNVTLEIEAITQLTARISPDNAESDIMWSSLDPTIATVDETGIVRAVDKGSTIIYATADNGVTGMAIVTVVNSREASSVTIEPSNLEIIVGGEEQLMAVVSPATSDTEITWLSSDPSVAEVTDEGVVIAVNPGLSVIYALADNGMTGLATVRVVTNEVTSVTIDPDILTLEIQMTGQFRAYVEPAVAQTTLTWTSNDTAIATVDADGVVEGMSHGFTVITATADNGVVGMAIVKVIDPNAEDNPDLGYGDNGVYVSAVRIREGDQLGLFAERPTGYENNDWRYEWYLRGYLEAEGKNVMVPAGKESGWTGTVQDITTETYQADITNGAGAEIILDVPEVRVYSRPLTPSELTRKGDGATCSFIAMSALSDTELEKLGYSFVFGYYDEEGVSHVISNGKSRYCHTTKEIYNNEGYRFWVYTAWTFPDGATITSGLRYLDGNLDENFNRSDFNFSTENEEDIEGRSEVHVYTVDGQTVGKDVDKLAPGIYIIYERNGKQVSTRKIIKR